jgi:hypothetical protein
MSWRIQTRLVRLERAVSGAANGVAVLEFLSGPIVERLPRTYTGERHLEVVNQRPEGMPGEDNCEFVERPGPEPPGPPTTGPRVDTICFIRPGERQ